MTDEITKEISKALTKKIKNNINIDELAKSMWPKIKAGLEREVMLQIRENWAEDIISNCDFRELESLLEEFVAKSFAKALGVPRKTKRKRR